jgi:hypothetical protein
MYIPLLNLERINNYAWGATTIAALKLTFNEENKGL